MRKSSILSSSKSSSVILASLITKATPPKPQQISKQTLKPEKNVITPIKSSRGNDSFSMRDYFSSIEDTSQPKVIRFNYEEFNSQKRCSLPMITRRNNNSLSFLEGKPSEGMSSMIEMKTIENALDEKKKKPSLRNSSQNTRRNHGGSALLKSRKKVSFVADQGIYSSVKDMSNHSQPRLMGVGFSGYLYKAEINGTDDSSFIQQQSENFLKSFKKEIASGLVHLPPINYGNVKQKVKTRDLHKKFFSNDIASCRKESGCISERPLEVPFEPSHATKEEMSFPFHFSRSLKKAERLNNGSIFFEQESMVNTSIIRS